MALSSLVLSFSKDRNLTPYVPVKSLPSFQAFYSEKVISKILLDPSEFNKTLYSKNKRLFYTTIPLR